MRASERLILEKAEKDLDAGLEHLRLRLRDEAHGPFAFLARGVEAAVLGGVAALELRPRMRDDVAFLMQLAHRVHAGEDPAKLAEEHLPRVLRLRELGLVVKTKDPRFNLVLDRCRAEMTKRLPDLGRMVALEDPRDYDDLVRRAFPSPEEPVRIVEENHALMMWIFDQASAHPELLRIPKGMVPKLVSLGREVTTWQTTRVLQGLRTLYPAPDSTTP